jgi:hypothetical protein
MRLNSGQQRQLIRELSPKFEKAFDEVRETAYSSFIENSIQAVGDGADSISYKEIQDCIYESLQPLFAKELNLFADTRISGEAWTAEDSDIFGPDFDDE